MILKTTIDNKRNIDLEIKVIPNQDAESVKDFCEYFDCEIYKNNDFVIVSMEMDIDDLKATRKTEENKKMLIDMLEKQKRHSFIWTKGIAINSDDSMKNKLNKLELVVKNLLCRDLVAIGFTIHNYDCKNTKKFIKDKLNKYYQKKD